MIGGWPLWSHPYIVGGILVAGWIAVREGLRYRKRKKPPP